MEPLSLKRRKKVIECGHCSGSRADFLKRTYKHFWALRHFKHFLRKFFLKSARKKILLESEQQMRLVRFLFE